MKILTTTALATALCALAACGPSTEASSGPKAPPGGQAEGGGGAAPAASRYTCTAHPEVVVDAPGSCRECGQALVPKT